MKGNGKVPPEAPCHAGAPHRVHPGLQSTSSPSIFIDELQTQKHKQDLGLGPMDPLSRESAAHQTELHDRLQSSQPALLTEPLLPSAGVVHKETLLSP